MPDVSNIEPGSSEVELLRRIEREARPRSGQSPWVLANMVSTLDGRASLGGRSGKLGGPLDRLMFQAIRAVADVVLVGAQTARTERYGAIRLPEPLQEARRQHDRAPLPNLAILSGSLDLPENTGIFDSPERLYVLTGASAPPQRRRHLEGLGVNVEVLPGERNAAVEALDALQRSGAGTILTEGGPSVLGTLIASDLVDELCLTLAPRLVGTGISLLLERPDLSPSRWELDRAWAADDDLFLRYLHRA